VQFRYDPEHVALRETVRRFLADVADETAVRTAMDSDLGWDPATVARLADEVGILGLAIPERYGGSGGGWIELGLVFHEAGRALLCAPLLSTAFSTVALRSAGDDVRSAELLPGIASGERVVAVAAIDNGTPATATGDGIEWEVTGNKTWVADGHVADTYLVAAGTDRGGALFAIDAAAAGVSCKALTTIDPTRRFATVAFSHAPARLIGELGQLPQITGELHGIMLTLLAAEQAGIAERVLEISVEYAKTREQFGRPIGSFQAIKHKLASVQIELEAAISAEMFALWTADNDRDNLDSVALIASHTCSEAAQLACSENIQVHGGIGATWEHSAHLYLKRATIDRQWFGGPQAQLEMLAAHLDAASPSG
jgi:alkylation response protein AidB-like acyl-CoA dehydrogenase